MLPKERSKYKQAVNQYMLKHTRYVRTVKPDNLDTGVGSAESNIPTRINKQPPSAISADG
jgi:hypothetical protein